MIGSKTLDTNDLMPCRTVIVLVPEAFLTSLYRFFCKQLLQISATAFPTSRLALWSCQAHFKYLGTSFSPSLNSYDPPIID